MTAKLIQSLKDLFAFHRKFTPFQKVLICSVFVGVILCILRSWWFLFASFTYTVTVYASVSITRYIITCNTHFPSDIVVVVCVTILDFINKIVAQFLEKIHFQHEEDELTVKATHESDINDKLKQTVKKNSSENNDGHSYDIVDTTDNSYSGTTHLYNEKIGPILNDDDISIEINGIIRLIKRDFFESWYKLISKEPSILVDADILFHDIVQGVQGRLYRANTKKVFEFILLMFKDHVHFVTQAQEIYKVQSKIRRKKKSSVKPIIQGESTPSSSSMLKMVYKSVEECYGSKVELHPAVKSIEIEHAYQKSIIELLLVHLLREDMHNSPTLKCALKEILMFNVLQKVMDLICNTTFLHERVIEITSNTDICVETIPTITVSETESSAGEVQSILTTRKQSKSKSDLIPQLELTEKVIKSDASSTKELDVNYKNDEQDVKWKEDTELHTVSQDMCNECNRLCSTDKDRISPRPHICSLGSTPAFFDINADPDRASLNSFTSLASNSSTESPVPVSVEKESVVTDTLQADICQTEETSPTEMTSSMQSKDQSQSGTSDHDSTCKCSMPIGIPTSSKASESSSDTESKPLANIFPTLKFPFANPLNSLSNFKRTSFKSLSPTSESASDAGLEQNKSDIHVKRSHSQGDVKSSSANNPWPTDGPSVFQGVRILTTETAKEAGSFGEYTLYNVEYEALYQSDDGELVHKSGVVKRRFREFVNLQSRLEDNPLYKKSIKDVKGPKKMLPSLPFGNMGKDTVDSRKELLETFLAALIRKADVCSGEEIKQFLGYSGDGHIAFVRKVPENTGPRIDQRLVKTMSGVFDKIVEGLPSLPQQLPRIISPFDQRDEKDEVSYDKLTDDTDDIDLIYVHGVDRISSERVECTFEKFIEHESNVLLDEDDSLNHTYLATSMLSWQDQQLLGASSSHLTSSTTSSHMTQENKDGGHATVLSRLSSSDIPLNDAVIDILVELLQKQNHWICRDKVIQAMKILLGKGLNRIVEDEVDILTSTEMCVFYLKTLRETIWPKGELSTEPMAQYSDLQKEQIRQQATRCLSDFMPGILRLIVEKEDMDSALEQAMESIKYEKLNRHFWYTVFDVVLEELFPEVNTQELQRKLSTAVHSE